MTPCRLKPSSFKLSCRIPLPFGYDQGMKRSLYEWCGIMFAATAIGCLGLWCASFLTEACDTSFSLEPWGTGIINGRIKLYLLRDPGAATPAWTFLGIQHRNVPQYSVWRVSLLYPCLLAAMAAVLCYWRLRRRPPAQPAT